MKKIIFILLLSVIGFSGYSQNCSYYKDNDGDTFGSSNASDAISIPCNIGKPTGYVTNNLDCNDALANIYPSNTIWYTDADGDGFGSTVIKATSCTQPSNSSLNNTDCDDTRSDVNNNTTWYLDPDGDGFGTTAYSIKQCANPSTSTQTFVTNSLDCAEGNASINPNTLWYLDGDKDGFGTSSTFIKQCNNPSTSTVKYVLNNTDCNDANSGINSGTIWYLDADKDGFGTSGTFLNQCADPSTATVKYVNNNTDCDDTAINLNPNTKWYLDDELDGLGDPRTFVTQCLKPTGNYVLDNTDGCPTIVGTNATCSGISGASQDQNYIITKTYKKASQIFFTTSDPDNTKTDIVYFDGLGRPKQKNANKQSNTGNDIITPIEYDTYGKETKEYLPFASAQNNSTFADPVVVIPDLTAQYKTNYGALNTNPFSQKEIETSPLNRVLRQAAPGNDWSLGSGHEIKLAYKTNTANEVKLFLATVTYPADYYTPTLSLSSLNGGYYGENELYKTITYDENTAASPLEGNGSTVEFKNKEGQVVLKRTYGIAGANTTNEAHDTYYVYDQNGNLAYVIPPKAVDLINASDTTLSDVTSSAVVANGSTLQLTATNSITLTNGFTGLSGSVFSAKIVSGNQNTLDNLCYQYKYDYRNRLIEKKLPGKQWEFIIYDNLDRPVATGPSNSPFNDLTSVGWLITKYDVFNRPVITGWMPAATVTAADRINLQAARNAETTNFNETKTTSAVNNINNVYIRYTNVVWPSNLASPAPATTYHILTVNYYDDYDYPDAPTVFTPVAGQAVFFNTTVKPTGMSTGFWIRIPEASTTNPVKAEAGYVLYDNKARAIRNYTSNFLGGYNQTDTNLDFSGNPVYTITTHLRAAGGTPLPLIRDDYAYSPQGRLISVKQTITGQTQQLIAYNTYDELGQLVSKKVGNNETAPLQIVNYNYNIRGWLKGINNVNQLTNATDPKDLFAFQINYNDIADVSKQLFNGNISQTLWASDNTDKTIRNYVYTYDALNRLKSATDNAGIFNEDNIQYDKNGNILKLKRKGAIVTTPSVSNPAHYGLMDDLVYSYDAGNKLMKVADAAAIDQYGFKDDAVNAAADTADDYTYDANGNMITDANKGITTNITYNHLNLPVKIVLPTGNIAYLYNATGQKVQKTVTETSSANVTTTEYLGGFQYKRVNSGTTDLQFFPTQEGYVANNTGTLSYVFQYKDHLGNIRLSYKNIGSVAVPSLQIEEENSYYPFGLKQTGYNNASLSTNDALKYKFNGKELQDDNIGGNQLNLYDYSARNYDPALGRWMNIDPLAEKMRRWSPYNYGLDNPVFFIDPDGMKPRAGQSGTYYDWDEGGYRTAEGAEATFDEAVANHSGGDGIDPPSKKKVEDMTPEEKNEYWRKYNEQTLLPLNESLINFAFIADGAGALSELFTVKASFKLTSLTGLFKNLLNKASRFTVQSSKFDYFFGRVVTGNEHNIQRSAQNLADLTTLGIKTEKDLMRVFNKAWNSSIINRIETSHGVSIIKSASVGKNGQAIQVSFFYKGGDMSLTPTISTIIPKL